MGSVNYDPLQPGEPRTAARVNAILNAFAAAAPLGSVNFAPDGLDARAFEAHPVGFRTGIIRASTRSAASLAVTLPYAQFSQNGVGFRMNAPGQVPASLNAGELLRVRLRVRLESTLAAGLGLGTPANVGNMQLRIVYNDGTTTLQAPASMRMALRSGSNADYGNDALFFCEGWIKGPLATLAWVEAQYTLIVAGTQAFPGASMMWATLFRRQNEA